MPFDLKAVTRKPPEVVRISVKRYDPESGRSWWQSYEVKTYRGMTVLDALLKIKYEIDHTVVMRYSCRMGVCGSCGVVVNGEPRLSCQTQIAEKATPERPEIKVEPLYNFPVIRDLLTDFSEMFEKHKKIKPYIIRKDKEERERPQLEYEQRPEELAEYYEYTLCIMCGLCNAACPVYASNPRFLGPQALAQAYRYLADTRDEAWRERLAELDADGSPYSCHFAASCSYVCPKVVDPAGAIQRLRSALLKSKLRLMRKKTAKNVPPMEQVSKPVPLPPEATLIEGVSLEEREKEEAVPPPEKLLG